MTSDNDKKAATQKRWGERFFLSNKIIEVGNARFYMLFTEPNEKTSEIVYEIFEPEELRVFKQQARAEVILKLRNLVNEEDYYDGGETWGEYTVPHWKDVKMLQDAINEFLTKLERGE